VDLRRSRQKYSNEGWLSDDEFKELLGFSNYLGRDHWRAYFELDLYKAKRNGYDIRDILVVLRSFEERLGGDVIEYLEELVDEELKVEVRLENSTLYVSSKQQLKPFFQELGYIPAYDRDRRAFKLKPYKYAEVVSELRKRGYRVEDKVGLLSSKLPRKLSFKGNLRDYQEEALAAWRGRGHRGVIALPTGAGKTVVAVAAIAELNAPTLIVVYTKEQVAQWLRFLREFSDSEGLIGAYYGDEKRLAPITVTTYQTAYKKLEVFAPRFSLLVVDEAHHLPAEKFKAIAIGMPAPYRLGLSATIEREDGKHEEIFPLMGGVVYHSTPGELAGKGYLAPYIIKTIRVELDPKTRREYERLRTEYRRLSGGRSFDEVLAAARRGDPTALEALRIHAKIKSIVQANEEKLREAERIARMELERGSKIIVFTQYKSQAEELARRLKAYLLHGGLDATRRRLVLEAFRRAPSGVLVVTTVGDEGLDIPDANVGILVSGTGSRRQFIQRLGRLLRPRPGKKAILYEIITARSSEELQARKRRGLV